ncbi:acyltransferase [Paraburkholderia agricolaris]|jgi:peptidoglycan/LPS O-acetylase OafA/YrhL|uniref:Acyltransferase n=1 Tax=Paraburkholderia agricolaris TaxID=2152888 RepID=A0ABW8ZUT4_9BURK
MIDRYKRLPSLTAGRGIAALMVAAFHASLVWPGSLSPIVGFGWLGVTFFFILSGFVLTWSLADQRSYSEFMIQRIARIYPVHIVCLSISLGSFLVFLNPLAGYVGTVRGTVLQLFLLHDFIPGHPEIRQAWNGVSWSLSAEFFFYLFAPFIIRHLTSLKTYTLLNVGASLYIIHVSIGVVAHTLHADRVGDFMQYHPIAYLPMFVYGIIGAILMRRGVRIHASIVLTLLLFVPVVAYCFRFGDINPIVMMALSIPAFLAFILDQARRDSEAKSTFLAHSLFEKVGEISFSLYMVHALLLGVIHHTFKVLKLPYHPTLFTFAFLLMSLLAAYLMYEIVEKPMRRLVLSRFISKPKAAAA